MNFRLTEVPALREAVDWKTRLRQLILQEGLIETRPSLAALERVDRVNPPSAVFLGVGLCTGSQLSAALPLDFLGMLLPAERVRRAVGARTLCVMLADVHALGNGFAADRVERRARQTEQTLWRIRTALRLPAMEIVRASSFHGSASYRRVLAEVGLRAGRQEDPYFIRQVADLEYLDRRAGGVLKVGWTISASSRVKRRRDEVAFDDRFRQWVGKNAAFVYCKAGRTLDDRRPKASPYVAVEPGRRVCLRPGEEVLDKLERARGVAAAATVKGVVRHLRAVTRSFSELVEPLRGPVDRRAQAVISWILAHDAALATREAPWGSSYASTSGR
jgi:hypothetical protein